MTKIVSNGLFAVPIYHGTTTLFLDSIKEYGLGGRNLVGEWQLVSVFRALFELAEQRLAGDNSWLRYREKASYIAYQKNSADNFNYNFQHGQVYITHYRGLANDYAVLNAGCELLQYIKGFVGLLSRVGAHNEVNKIIRGNVESILSKSYQPVLLQLNSVKLADVESENGIDKDELLSLWEKAFETGIVDKALTNWRLSKSHPWDNIAVKNTNLKSIGA